MENLTVAAVNFHSDFGEVKSNLRRIRRWVAQLSKQGAEIICFPELSVCGYANSWQISPFVDTIPGEITAELQEIAADHQISLIAGMAEQGEDGNRYISQVLVQASGRVDVYRKTHLSPQETDFFSPGNHIPVFDHPKARIGILVCHDLRFPEVCTMLALQGAEVIFVSLAASPYLSYTIADKLHRLLPARALDNTVFIVACNQVGISHQGYVFGGAAMIVKPNGEIAREVFSTQQSVLKCRLSAKALRNARRTPALYCLEERRPEIYRDQSHDCMETSH